MKTILLIDESVPVRKGLRILLEGHEGWRVCGEAENGLEGIRKAQELHPDVIVLDLSMPVMNGIEASHQLKLLMPEVPIVMFTNFPTPEVQKVVKNNVAALVSKTEGGMPLPVAIGRVLAAPAT